MKELKTINAFDQGLAYALLFEQQQVLNPGLTPDQFRAWLRQTVAKKAKAAARQKGAK